jgi:GMP synthase (glutamine-hydrolysing)
VLPEDTVVLATGERAPHQLVRVGDNVYAAQFHPEIDTTSLVARLIAYRQHGYYPDSEFEETIAWARSADVGSAGNDIIAAFVRRHAAD